MYKIGPSKNHLILLGLCAFGCLAMWIFGVESKFPKTSPWFLFVLSILAFLSMCKSYVFTDNWISMNILGIPVKKFKRNDVIQFARVPNPSAQNNSADKQVLLVISAPGPVYDPQKNSLQDFIKQHKDNIIKIPLMGSYEKSCVPALERLYQVKVLVV